MQNGILVGENRYMEIWEDGAYENHDCGNGFWDKQNRDPGC